MHATVFSDEPPTSHVHSSTTTGVNTTIVTTKSSSVTTSSTTKPHSVTTFSTTTKPSSVTISSTTKPSSATTSAMTSFSTTRFNITYTTNYTAIFSEYFNISITKIPSIYNKTSNFNTDSHYFCFLLILIAPCATIVIACVCIKYKRRLYKITRTDNNIEGVRVRANSFELDELNENVLYSKTPANLANEHVIVPYDNHRLAGSISSLSENLYEEFS